MINANIDYLNFTPISATLGGVLIGIAVSFFFLATGRNAGVSGILNDLILSKSARLHNLLFILGLVLAPLVYTIIMLEPVKYVITPSFSLIVLGGFLVGFGTKLGNGCTSGHGVCGISQFSIRSILATCVFLAAGILTVTLMDWFVHA